MTPPYETILMEDIGRVGLIRFNRPKALNALNSTMIAEIMDALEAYDRRPDIGAIVLTGNKRAFAAGEDIKEMASESAVSILTRDHISTFDRIMHLRKTVIAAGSGWCLGGGTGLFHRDDRSEYQGRTI